MKKIIAFYGTIVLKLDDLLQKELNCIWEEGGYGYITENLLRAEHRLKKRIRY